MGSKKTKKCARKGHKPVYIGRQEQTPTAMLIAYRCERCGHVWNEAVSKAAAAKVKRE